MEVLAKERKLASSYKYYWFHTCVLVHYAHMYMEMYILCISTDKTLGGEYGAWEQGTMSQKLRWMTTMSDWKWSRISSAPFRASPIISTFCILRQLFMLLSCRLISARVHAYIPLLLLFWGTRTSRLLAIDDDDGENSTGADCIMYL